MPAFLIIIILLVLVTISILLADRFLLWMEKCGWIYYRRKKPKHRSIGSAFLEIQSMIEPGKKATVEEIKRVPHDEQYSGDPINGDTFFIETKKSQS